MVAVQHRYRFLASNQDAGDFPVRAPPRPHIEICKIRWKLGEAPEHTFHRWFGVATGNAHPSPEEPRVYIPDVT